MEVSGRNARGKLKAESKSAVAAEKSNTTNNRYSVHTVENSRYSLHSPPRPDHSIDDRSFVCTDLKGLQALAVFDGHDGSNASDSACDYMRSFILDRPFLRYCQKYGAVKTLESMFLKADKHFFKQMEPYVAEKREIMEIIKGLSSYEAYIQFPDLVERLQQLDLLVSGGTTAVVAVVVGDTLYVANTGDSRAVLVEEDTRNTGTLIAKQLSEDHTVNNEKELQRLKEKGLDPETLKGTGRLGSQENTRCIGDYCLKEGYKDLDSISHATRPPGTAFPSITKMSIHHSCKYLLLMTDGVYKALEDMHRDIPSYQAMDDLVARIQAAAEETCSSTSFRSVAGVVVDRLAHDHHKVYMDSARADERSPMAVQCRKRDDMTLVVYQLET